MSHTDSMDQMYRKHSQMIYAFLLSKCGDGLLAEELTQETFYQAVKSLDRFKGQSSASTWLCGIANNVWLAHLRKQKRSGEIFSSDENDSGFTSASAESPEDNFIRKSDNLALMKALHQIKEPMREVLYLRLMDEHVAQCPSCSKAAKDAKESFEDDFSCEAVEFERKDVDYLRKVRTSSRKKIIMGICITLCLALIFAGIKLFVYGSPDYGYTVSIFSDSAGKYQVRGTLTGSASVFSRYKIRATEDGGEELIVYSCLTSPLNRTGGFSIGCSVNGKYLDVNGTRIMADGTIYNAALAQQLFEAAHPYIGDMPANNDLAFALGISKNTGAYANKLHTEREPYGWEFVFKETDDIKKQKEISRKMELYAPVLLALVDNCDQIMWSFADDPENAPDEPAYKVTSADAGKLLGTDVKSFAESPEKVMELLYELGL